jgi:hypothetical protein
VDWTPDLSALSESEQRNLTPPPFFALTSATHPLPQYRLIKPRDSDDDHHLTAWTLSSDHELTATWTNGYTGVRLILRQRSTDGRFYGRAEPLSDGGGTPPNRGTVILGRVPCWQEAIPFLQ